MNRLRLEASTTRLGRLHRFGDEPAPPRGIHYAPVADFDLLPTAYDVAVARPGPGAARVGPVLSTDLCYHPRPGSTARMAEHGVLAVEMEASALSTLAAEFGRRALAICTVSDHVATGEQTTVQERQETFTDMVEIALETVLRVGPGAAAPRADR